MISVTLTNEFAEGLLDDLRRVFPALMAGTALPPMAEQPKRDEPAPVEPAKRGRKPKEDAKADAGESAAAEGAATGISGPISKETAVEKAAQTNADGAANGVEVPDIDLVRAKLKQMGATDGLGHDKVFEVLGKYKATNASSVPTEKRADLIAEIDGLLEDARIAAMRDGNPE